MKQKLQRVWFALLMVSFVLTGASCTKAGDPAANQAYRSIKLEYWTVFNSPDDYRAIIADYQAIHPNIRIDVKKFRFDEYEEQLLDALAEDRGPDIFSLHNTWVPGYRTKILPLPAQTTLAYQFTTGSIKKETVTQLQSTRSLNIFDLRSSFLEQVYNDVYLEHMYLEDEEVQFGEESIHGLPIAFDTLVMYYNRDLLDNAGIAKPATTWNEFQEHVGRLARFDTQGKILTAGAALGTSDNVPRSVDILATLMMQNGAEMTTENNEVSFHVIPDELRGTRSTVPGEEALRYYISFANQNQKNYTWNEDQADAFETFLQGKLGYFFGYSYHQEQIRGLAPKLNFGVSGIPQIQGNPPVYFANYWVESVSRKTANVDAAWDFVQFMTGAEEAQKFLTSANRPTALRGLVDAQAEDPDLYIFASQLLASKSWYNGQDAAAMEGIMKDLIDDAREGTEELDDLLKLAAQKVQQTYRY